MKLFETGYIGKMKLKNRIFMGTMGHEAHDPDGGYSVLQREYFAERAKGGTGLIMCSGIVSSKFEGHIGNVFESESVYTRFEQFVDAIHGYGSKVCVQLIPGAGRVGAGLYGYEGEPISASEVPTLYNPDVICREMTKDEIHFLVEAFGKSAAMVKRAGADCIQIHAYGGYLTDQFMSAAWNKRTDEYGGDLNGRMRLPLEFIAEVKKTCGEDFPIIFKFTPDHCFEGGRKLEEGLEIAKMLEAAGVHALHVDVGCYETIYNVIPPIYDYKENIHAEASGEVKKVVNIPVISSGKLGDPELAEKVLQEGKLDFVGLARPLLGDPHWANKVKEGRIDDITPCIGCNEGCVMRIGQGKRIGCAVNPLAGKDKENLIKPSKNSKSVLVIGGGPGGIEAAITAAKVGHKVELWEKSGNLGGNLIAAGAPEFKMDILPLINHYRAQINKLGVNVKYMKEATAADVEKVNPDLVVLATGSDPIIPEIPGADKKNVCTAVDVLKKKKYPGNNVVVVGGGFVGIETALHLAMQGKKVTVVEMLDRVLAETMSPIDIMMLSKMIAESGITILTSTKLIGIEDAKITVESNGVQSTIDCDTVVLAIGFRANNSLEEELKDKVKDIVTVGDAVAPRKVLNATWEGYHAIRAFTEKDI